MQSGLSSSFIKRDLDPRLVMGRLVGNGLIMLSLLATDSAWYPWVLSPKRA